MRRACVLSPGSVGEQKGAKGETTGREHVHSTLCVCVCVSSVCTLAQLEHCRQQLVKSYRGGGDKDRCDGQQDPLLKYTHAARVGAKL